MNEEETFIANALTAHFGTRIAVKTETDSFGKLFRVNERIAYYVSNEFSINGIPLGKKQYLYSLIK